MRRIISVRDTQMEILSRALGTMGLQGGFNYTHGKR